MVKNKVLLLMTIVIMIIAALFMLINRLIYGMPDWVVRTIGIVVSADLVVFVYSSVKTRRDDIPRGNL